MGSDVNRSLLRHVLVPVASEDDGRTSAAALAPYDPDRVTILFVVEKAGGAPDKVSPTQAKTHAADAFAAFQEVLDADEERIAYGTDVVATIFEEALAADASTVAFTSRGGGRLLQFLSGDVATKLVTDNEIPVLSLPSSDDS